MCDAYIGDTSNPECGIIYYFFKVSFDIPIETNYRTEMGLKDATIEPTKKKKHHHNDD